MRTGHAPSLAEPLENLKSGLLWVARDDEVRYANADAGARTGLAALSWSTCPTVRRTAQTRPPSTWPRRSSAPATCLH
jgi:hypothetical protein